MTSFILKASQAIVKDSMVQACRTYGRFMNEGRAGCGKTPITTVGVDELGTKHSVILGLASTTGMDVVWKKHFTQQNLTKPVNIGWEALHGTRGRVSKEEELVRQNGFPFDVPMPNNPYLTRSDRWMGTDYVTTFTVTQAWIDLVKEGVALICDEIQRAKGESLSNQALFAMVRVIHPHLARLTPGVGGSYVVYLSATILNRIRNAENILRGLHFVDEQPAFTFRDKAWHVAGAAMLIQCCRTLDHPTTERILRATIHSSRNHFFMDQKTGKLVADDKAPNTLTLHFRRDQRPGDVACLFLLTMVLAPVLSAGVREPFNWDPEVTRTYKAIQHRVIPEHRAKYQEALQKLDKAVKEGDMPAQIRITNEMEGYKRKTYENGAIAHISKGNRKAVIYYNTRHAVQETADALNAAGYPTAIIMGGVSASERDRIMKLFNESNNKLVCIVGVITAMSEGISLHSTRAEWYRKAFVSPSPNTIATAQSFFRTDRHGVKGEVELELVFGLGEGGFNEAKLFKRIMEDSAVLAAVAPSQRADGVPLPGDLPLFVMKSNGTLITNEEHERRVAAKTKQAKDARDEAIRQKRLAEELVHHVGMTPMLLHHNTLYPNSTENLNTLMQSGRTAEEAVLLHLQWMPGALDSLLTCKVLIHPGGEFDAVLHKAFQDHRNHLLTPVFAPGTLVCPWHVSALLPSPIFYRHVRCVTLRAYLAQAQACGYDESMFPSFARELTPHLARLYTPHNEIGAFVHSIRPQSTLVFPGTTSFESFVLDTSWRALNYMKAR